MLLNHKFGRLLVLRRHERGAKVPSLHLHPPHHACPSSCSTHVSIPLFGSVDNWGICVIFSGRKGWGWGDDIIAGAGFRRKSSPVPAWKKAWPRPQSVTRMPTMLLQAAQTQKKPREAPRQKASSPFPPLGNPRGREFVLYPSLESWLLLSISPVVRAL